MSLRKTKCRMDIRELANKIAIVMPAKNLLNEVNDGMIKVSITRLFDRFISVLAISCIRISGLRGGDDDVAHAKGEVISKSDDEKSAR